MCLDRNGDTDVDDDMALCFHFALMILDRRYIDPHQCLIDTPTPPSENVKWSAESVNEDWISPESEQGAPCTADSNQNKFIKKNFP